jgi:hypothetical protein
MMRTVRVADVLGRATFVSDDDIQVEAIVWFQLSPHLPMANVEDNLATTWHRDPRTLNNLPEILSSLSALQSEEAELSNSLTELLNARNPIIISLNRLYSLISHLHGLRLDASRLLNKVSQTAETAERVGGQVRSLDDEMNRVREAGERVGQVMELKVTSLKRHSSSVSHIFSGLLGIASVFH